jgi:hypothetical protein
MLRPNILAFAAGFLKQAELRKSVELQAHQVDAVRRSRDTGGMILNWGLGSGKTIGSLAIAEEKGGKVLVVVPASLRENFKKEMHKAVVPSRHKAYTVISYDAFRKDPQGWVRKVKPQTLIADEVHRLRNSAPREPFEQIREQIPFMVGLTGSLINNRPEEVVPLANLAAGVPIYPSIEEFKRRHLKEEKISPGFWGTLKGVKPGLKEVVTNKGFLGEALGEVIHRFVGDEKYLAELPKVNERVVNVTMSPAQENLYKAVTGSNPTLAYKLKHNIPPSKSELRDMNAFLTAARQVSNAPQSYSKAPIDSPKFKAMVGDLKEEAKRDKNFRAVIYSSFLESGVLPMIKDLSESGITASAFIGGLSDKKRQAMVSDFNAGKIQVLGLSPAGGEGLDLKGVKMVQLTEEHWNPERGRQAVGRSARFRSHEHLPEGERKVDVTRYMAVHPEPGFVRKLFGGKRPMSADQWIDARRREKLELNQQVLAAIPTYAKAAFVAGFALKTASLASDAVRKTVELARAAATAKDTRDIIVPELIDRLIQQSKGKGRKKDVEISKEALLVPAMGIGSGTRRGVELARDFASSIKRVPRVGSSLARQGFERGADAANRTWKPAAGAVRRGGGPPKTQMARIMDLLDS